MQNSYNHQARVRLVATCLTLVVIAGAVLFTDHLKSEEAEGGSMSIAGTTSQNASTMSRNAPHSMGSHMYTDGTYSASSDYYVPNGYEHIKVQVSLQNGVVKNASIRNSQGDPESAHFQQDFASVYKSYVIGQKIDNLNLSYVAGASDTTQGFNDALNKIISQAQTS